MELDLSALNNLAHSSPYNEFSEVVEGKTLAESKMPAEGHIAANTGIQRLQRQADSNREVEERAARIYKEYQDNIRTAGSLKTEIIKGVKAGESCYNLLLKATKAISLMTSDSLFYSQIETDTQAIYGAGLLETEPLAAELNGVEERLRRLREAFERDTEPEDSKRRIASAIKAHEGRAEQLRQLMATV